MRGGRGVMPWVGTAPRAVRGAKVQIGLRPVQRCKRNSRDRGRDRGWGRDRHATPAPTPERTYLGIVGRDLSPEWIGLPLPRPRPLTKTPLHFCTRRSRSCTFARSWRGGYAASAASNSASLYPIFFTTNSRISGARGAVKVRVMRGGKRNSSLAACNA